jgi:hypothetical protein
MMMNKQVVSFYIYVLAIALLQIGIVMQMPHLLPVNDTVTTIIFFAILTAAIYPIASIGRKSNDGYTFIIAAYISIGLRFILSLCYVVYYKLTRTSYDTGFILALFTSYILFTIFEIYWLTAKLRPISTEKPNHNESINN